MTTAYEQGRAAFHAGEPGNPYIANPRQKWLADQWAQGYDNANEVAYDRRNDDPDWQPEPGVPWNYRDDRS